jgi:transcription initiation factor TFIIE subunit beta
MTDLFSAQLSAFKKSLKSSTDLPQQKRFINQPSSLSSSSNTTTATTSTKRPNSSLLSTDNNDNNDNNDILLTKKLKITESLDNNNVDNNKITSTITNTSSSIIETKVLSAAAQAARASNQGNLTMKLMSSSDYIKSKDREVPIFELETSLGFKIDNQLLKCLSNVDRIKYNPENSSFQYLSLHNIKTGDDLLNVLKNQPAYAGLSVKQLKDGWNNCLITIENLEKQNKIIVHKTKKDNSPRHIWLNFDNLPIRVYNGVQSIHNWELLTGQVPPQPQPQSLQSSSSLSNSQNLNNSSNSNNKIKSLDVIFYEMWNNVDIPNHDDLVKLLLDNGLKPTNAEPESMKSKKITSVKERKQKKTRRGKITNIHMKGILKDYSSKMK